MITVEYMPAVEKTPLPHGGKIYVFLSFGEFKQWVYSYVCNNCLIDYRDWEGNDPETIADWLAFGCGCEIYIEDPNDRIDWSSKMRLPDSYQKIREATR